MSLLHRTIIVNPGTQLVEYVRGAFTKVLEPGEHKRPRKATYEHVLVREQISTIPVQEIPTSDGLTVRVTAAVRWTVDDARRYIEVAAAPFDAIYLAVQIALRDVLVEVEAEAAGRHLRQDAPTALLEAARVAGSEVGVAVRDVGVKDVLLPAEMRAAQVDLVTARTRGLAELEKARAETAALRSLANAAKLLDDHPALAQLRLIQAVPFGTTLELSVGSSD
jgi:regulator of protease activity HflC (stomatin/prohibitin superfamily)